MNKTKIVLILILILASLMRFYKLGSYPALNADEASTGYDAYSLLLTGKDQHGNEWPIHFQSFNDYKPGLYTYLTIPLVKYLGLNEWSVRIPGATSGVITVYLIYLLVKKLFKEEENEKLALFSALFLAISPWHIQFSRGGWEVNVASMLVVLGFYLFLVSNNGWKRLSLSIICFILSMYTYHSTRIFVPLFGLGLFIKYRKNIFAHLTSYLTALIIGIVILLPLARDLMRPEIFSRAGGVGLLADKGPLNRANEQRGEYKNPNVFYARVLHNKFINYGLDFAENYTKHYWGEFLFLSGDSVQRNKVPETGQMYLFDILLLIVGIYTITRKHSNWELLIWWLVIAPVASSLTFQSPSALRSQIMIIPLVIFSAYGLLNIILWLQTKRETFLILGQLLIAILIAWNFARYLHMYYVHMAKEYPFSSQYGVKELVTYVKENQDKYQNIIITDRYDQPYILFLFYLQYNPASFQDNHKLTGRDQYGFSTVRNFDKYYFEAVDFEKVNSNYPHSLVVGTPEEIPGEVNTIEKVYGNNGYNYFDIVAN